VSANVNDASELAISDKEYALFPKDMQEGSNFFAITQPSATTSAMPKPGEESDATRINVCPISSTNSGGSKQANTFRNTIWREAGLSKGMATM
jgi:hypothetical protein